MALFLWLIILLSIAWGLADFQLQSRIEREPPPVPVTRPAVPPKADVAPAVDGAPGSVPPTDSTEPVPNAERSVPTQDTHPAPPMPERAQE